MIALFDKKSFWAVLITLAMLVGLYDAVHHNPTGLVLDLVTLAMDIYFYGAAKN